jgi:IS30 family transposase
MPRLLGPAGSRFLDLQERTTIADLQEAAERLNNRPRKSLGWQTPAERLAALTPASI